MAKRQRSKGAGALFKRDGRGPWLASWFDHAGRRVTRSTRTTDRAAADRILSKYVADAALRREGVVDPAKDRLAVEGRRSIDDHVRDYLAHCRHAGHAERHVAQKASHLRRMIGATHIGRLSELTADVVEHFLASVKDTGASARTMNFARQICVAFASWCVRTKRLDSNPLTVVPKQDESRDRRRVRRPLTDDELARLIAVARERGRAAWYLAAVLAGLRKGDLLALTWADVDFDAATITIRAGKAKRVDVVPMHPQLAAALRELFDREPATPSARVFPTVVTDATRLRDFVRAGIARVVETKNAETDEVETTIETKDDEGNVVDLHALRTTLGTQLALAGVAPQVAQRIMRHGDYRTTLAHYTMLRVADSAKALESIPAVGAPTPSPKRTAARSTGTDGASPDTPTAPPIPARTAAADASEHGPRGPQQYPQQLPQQLGRADVRDDATPREDDAAAATLEPAGNTGKTASFDGSVRRGTMPRDNSAGVTQLVECQLPKLNVAGSNPVARST
jgi:integrase